MKHYTRFCSLLLAGVLALFLAACSSTDAAEETPLPSDATAEESTLTPTDSPELSTSTSILPTDFVANTSAEDICLEVTGVPGSTVLATIGDIPVTAYSYLYWLTYNASELEYAMLYNYGLELDWSLDPTLSDSLRDAALSSAVRYALITAKAKELGYEMTSEHINELDAAFASAIASMGGEEAFQDELRKAAVDYDTFYEIQAASYYYSQLRDGLFSARPTEEEMDTYIEENDILFAKHILFMTVDSTTREPLDDATIAEKKALAEDVLAQLQASSDPLIDFDYLMLQHSEDTGLYYNPDGYTFTAGEMVAEFETATRELEYGQISGLVESPYGYHIILRLDPDTETAREDYRNDLISAQMDTWVSEANIARSEEYETLDAALCYEKYKAYQEAFAAEQEANTESNS